MTPLAVSKSISSPGPPQLPGVPPNLRGVPPNLPGVPPQLARGAAQRRGARKVTACGADLPQVNVGPDPLYPRTRVRLYRSCRRN